MINPSEIREQMKVIGSDGQPVGTVDKVEGNRIKLSKNDPAAQGQHRYIPLDSVSSSSGISALAATDLPNQVSDSGL